MKDVFDNANNAFIKEFNEWYHKKELHKFIPYEQLATTPLVVTQGIYNAFLLKNDIVILYTAKGASMVHTSHTSDLYLIKLVNKDKPLRNYKAVLSKITKDYPNSILPF